MKKFISRFMATALILTMIPFGNAFAADDITKVEVEKVPTVGRFEKQKAADVVLQEQAKDSWSEHDEFGLKLPGGLHWNKETKINGKKITDANLNGRELIFEVAVTKEIDRVRIEPVIDVDKGADLGDIEVVASGRFENKTTSFVFAKIVDYGMGLSTVRSMNTEYGNKDAIKVSFVVDELIDNSMIEGAKYDLTLVNAVFDKGEKPVIKTSGGTKPLKTEFTADDNMMISTDKAGEKTSWTISLSVKPTFETTGDIMLKLEGRDVKEEIVLVDVLDNVEMLVEKPAVVNLGYQDQELPTITLKEKAAGGLIEGTHAIRILPEHEGVYFAKPEVKVVDGNAEITNVKLNKNVIEFTVSRASRKMSTIEITGLKVTPSNFAYLGDYKAELLLNFGRKSEVKVGEKVLFSAVSPTVEPTQPIAKRVAQFIIDQKAYTLFVDGNKTTNEFDVAPYIDTQANRTMMSVKAVGNALGMKVEYEGATKTVVITSEKDGKTDVVKFVIGEKYAIVNDKVQPIDVAPVIKDSRTFIPVAYVAHFMGAKTEWDVTLKMVTVSQ